VVLVFSVTFILGEFFLSGLCGQKLHRLRCM